MSNKVIISRQSARCRQMLVFPSQRLGHPAAVDNLAICQNARCVQVLVLPSQSLVRPAVDDDFVK